MGCDITAICQAKRRGRWYTLTLGNPEHKQGSRIPWEKNAVTTYVFPEQCYALFGVLAGVRDENEEPIADPRGLPEDYDFGDLFEGEHSLTWVTLQEIKDYHWTHMQRICCRTFFELWMPKFLALPDDPKDIRFVMGFD